MIRSKRTQNLKAVSEGFINKTSTPILDRKFESSASKVDTKYKLFCDGLERQLTYPCWVLKSGRRRTNAGDDFISGNLIVNQESSLDILNQPISDDRSLNESISQQIINLLSDSFKALLRKTRGIYGKLRRNTG
ncbi:hypothetical protein ABEB36_008188 [Hypothenemus hampei]|uniref:Uncharacterized protein n=1 Tax=Hypothenemus hampei TaxID=57062 RepID=A0ABD1EL16_HYPHA